MLLNLNFPQAQELFHQFEMKKIPHCKMKKEITVYRKKYSM